MSEGSRCFFANCTPLWSSIGTEETHTEAGGRETRIGRLDPPIVWSDDAGEFAVERFCVCIKTPVKGVVRLLCNGAPDGNFYGRVFARLRMADKYDWKREQADEKLSGELYDMIVTDTAAAKTEDTSTHPEMRVYVADVRRVWHGYWEKKSDWPDHRYAKDFAAFLGERVLTDFDLRDIERDEPSDTRKGGLSE